MEILYVKTENKVIQGCSNQRCWDSCSILLFSKFYGAY